MIDIVEICQHWHAGRSMSEISTSLGVEVVSTSVMYEGSGVGSGAH